MGAWSDYKKRLEAEQAKQPSSTSAGDMLYKDWLAQEQRRQAMNLVTNEYYLARNAARNQQAGSLYPAATQQTQTTAPRALTPTQQRLVNDGQALYDLYTGRANQQHRVTPANTQKDVAKSRQAWKDLDRALENPEGDNGLNASLSANWLRHAQQQELARTPSLGTVMRSISGVNEKATQDETLETIRRAQQNPEADNGIYASLSASRLQQAQQEEREMKLRSVNGSEGLESIPSRIAQLDADALDNNGINQSVRQAAMQESALLKQTRDEIYHGYEQQYKDFLASRDHTSDDDAAWREQAEEMEATLMYLYAALYGGDIEQARKEYEEADARATNHFLITDDQAADWYANGLYDKPYGNMDTFDAEHDALKADADDKHFKWRALVEFQGSQRVAGAEKILNDAKAEAQRTQQEFAVAFNDHAVDGDTLKNAREARDRAKKHLDEAQAFFDKQYQETYGSGRSFGKALYDRVKMGAIDWASKFFTAPQMLLSWLPDDNELKKVVNANANDFAYASNQYRKIVDASTKAMGDSAWWSRGLSAVEEITRMLIDRMAIGSLGLETTISDAHGEASKLALQSIKGSGSIRAGLGRLKDALVEGAMYYWTNPEYWSVFLMEAGNGYQENMKLGMSKGRAALLSLMNASLNAKIEFGLPGFDTGGLQTMFHKTGGHWDDIFQAALSMLDNIKSEGLEEIEQGAVEGFIRKVGWNNGEDLGSENGMPWFSTTAGEEAAFNLKDISEAGIVGGLTGGAGTAPRMLIDTIASLNPESFKMDKARQIVSKYVQQYSDEQLKTMVDRGVRSTMEGTNYHANAVRIQDHLSEATDAEKYQLIQSAREYEREQETRANALKAFEYEKQQIDIENKNYGDIETAAKAIMPKQWKAVTTAWELNPTDNLYGFTTEFNRVYNQGLIGTDQDAVLSNLKTLTREQALKAYGMGLTEYQGTINKTVSGRNASTISKVTFTDADGNTSDFDVRSEAFHGLKSVQKRAAQIGMYVARVFGVNINYTLGKKDANGKYSNPLQGDFDPSTNTITIDLNAGLDTSEDENTLSKYVAARILGHELTHFAETWAPEEYTKFRNTVLSALRRKGVDVDDLIDEQMSRAEAARELGYDVKEYNYDDASREVVADSMTDILRDLDLARMVAEEDPTLWGKIVNALKSFVNRIRDHFNQMGRNQYAGARALQEQVNGQLRYMDEIIKQFEEMGKKAAENVRAANAENIGNVDDPNNVIRPSIKSGSSALGVQANRDEKTGQITFTVNGHPVSHITSNHIRYNSGIGVLIKAAYDNGFISKREMLRQIDAARGLMNLIMKTQDPEQVWAWAGAAIFSAVKKNADGQYTTTIDFTTVCRKTQNMVTAMSASMKNLHRGLTKDEVTELQRKVAQSGSEVFCPVCYVFSRWAGIGEMLDDIRDKQNKYDKMGVSEVKERVAVLEKQIIDKGWAQKTKKGYKITSKNTDDLIKEKADEKTEYQAELERLEKMHENPERQQELQKKIDRLAEDIGILGEWTWASQIITRPDYKPVPDEILYDLNKGKEFAEEYAAVWRYRTTRGPSSGKAILPYTDMRLGDIILGADKANELTIMGKDLVRKSPFVDTHDNVILKGDFNKEQAKRYRAALQKMQAQNLIGGQRFQSTSDFRYEYALDYLQAFWELQAIGGKLQTYTKVVEFADMIATIGGDVNLSVMPLGRGYKDGKLIYSNVTGMNINAALEANRKFDNAQLILVGINDQHIMYALEDSEETGGINVGFVIPYHTSGASIEDFISELVKNLGEEYRRSNYADYSDVTNDVAMENVTPEQKRRAEIRELILKQKGNSKRRNKLSDADMDLIRGVSADITGRSFEDLYAVEQAALSGNEAALKDYLSWSAGVLNDLYEKMYNGAERNTFLTADQAEHIMPHEYWNKNTTRKNAYVNGFIFRSYCHSLGLHPRFTGWYNSPNLGIVQTQMNEAPVIVNGQEILTRAKDFSASRGYWKTLIDRPMYDNNGNYREQRRINVSRFDNRMLKPEYAETIYPEYKIQEPNKELATRIGEEYAQELRDTGRLVPAEKDGKRYSLRAAQRDEEYENAVKRGDMVRAQQMVDEAAKEARYIKAGFHGTLNGGFTTFDKAYAGIGGNSGAGFYFSSNRADSDSNYSDVEGADNWFKANHLADRILDEFGNSDEEVFEYEGFEITEGMPYEDVVQIAKQILQKNPATYHVYLDPGKAYIRDFRNSTNLLDGFHFDESDFDRNDYDSDEEYEDDMYTRRTDDMYEYIANAVYNGISIVDDNYEIYDRVDYDGIIGKLAESAMDYGTLTWDDLVRTLEDQYIEIGTYDMDGPTDGSHEIARSIVEAFGYDSIEDREVSKKFNQLKNMGNAGDTVHYIMFRPEQIKLADPVTYDANGKMIPLSERFNRKNDDIRYSLRTREESEEAYDAAMENGNVKAAANALREAGVDGIPFRDAEGDIMPMDMALDLGRRFSIRYQTGNREPDTTIVNGNRVAFIGDRPENYVPKKIGYAYKLMEQWPDGTLHALFAGTQKPIELGVWQYAEGFTPDEQIGQMSKNLADRYGWHMGTGAPATHHLMGTGDILNPKMIYPSKYESGHPKGSKRVWVEVMYDATRDYNPVADQTTTKDIRGLIPFGGYYSFQEGNLSLWILSSAIKFNRVLEEPDRARLLEQAGIDEQEMWRTQVLPKKLKAAVTSAVKAIASGDPKKSASSEEKLGKLIDIYNRYDLPLEYDAKGKTPEQIDIYERNGFIQSTAAPRTKLTDEEVRAMRNKITSGIVDNPDLQAPVRFSLRPTSQADQDYDAAVKNGNVEEQQRLVDEAASNAGYRVKAMHGSPATDITTFDKGRAGSHTGTYSDRAIWFTDSAEFADEMSYEQIPGSSAFRYRRGKKGKVYDTYLRITNPFTVEAMTSQMRDDLYEMYKIKQAGFRLKPKSRAEFDAEIETALSVGNDQFVKFYIDYDYLIRKGYDAITARLGTDIDGLEYGVFSPDQIKSSDPITYDDNGKVIPLSERFKSSNDDIRYSLRYATLSNRDLLRQVARDLDGIAVEAGFTENQIASVWGLLNDIDSLDQAEAMLNEATKRLRQTRAGYDLQIKNITAQRDEAAPNSTEWYNLDARLQDMMKRKEDAMQPLRQAWEERNAEKKRLETVVSHKENSQSVTNILKKARDLAERNLHRATRQAVAEYRKKRDEKQAARLYRETVKKEAKTLREWLEHPDRKNVRKHIPMPLQSAMIDFLLSIDESSERRLKGGPDTLADARFVQNMLKLQQILSGIDPDTKDPLYFDLPAGFDKELSKQITQIQTIIANSTPDGTFVLNRMDSEQLKGLRDTIKTLRMFIQNFNSFYNASLYQHVYEAAEDTIETLSNIGLHENSNADWFSNFVDWQNLRPAYGFERFGDGGRAVWNSIVRGQTKLAFLAKELVDFSKSAYEKKDASAWNNEVKTINLPSGGTVRMTVSQIMSLYELNKRDAARLHLYGEGFRPVNIERRGRRTITNQTHKVTEDDVNYIISFLTEDQKKVADKLQRYMANRGAELANEISMKRFMLEQFTDANYFPINSDGRNIATTEKSESMGNSTLFSLINASFTQELNPNADNSLAIYPIFEVFSKHMADVAQYNAFALPVLDALKWLNYRARDEEGKLIEGRNVKNALMNAYGFSDKSRAGYAVDFVKGIIAGLNGTEAQGSKYEGIMTRALHHFNATRVAFNGRVVVQQPLAIARSLAILDPKDLVTGIKPARIRSNVEEMRKYSGMALWKSLGFFDVNISNSLSSMIAQDDDWTQRMTEIGLAGAELGDTVAWAIMWEACKNQAARENYYDEARMIRAAAIFDEVILKTQVVDSVLTKSEYMRQKNIGNRLFSSFMAEPTTTASMLTAMIFKFRTDIRTYGMSEAWRMNRGNMARITAVFALTALLNASITAIYDAWRDDDDYQTFWQKVVEHFKSNIVQEINPGRLLPVISDVVEFAEYIIRRDWFSDKDAYYNPVSLMHQSITAIDNASKKLKRLYDGEKNISNIYAAVSKLVDAVSGVTGIPAYPIIRELKDFWNNVAGRINKDWKVRSYDPGPKERIKDAFMSGYLTEEEARAEIAKAEPDKPEASNIVGEWASVRDLGIKYDDLDDAYIDDEISFDELVDAYINYGYMSESEAMEKASLIDWKKQNGSTMSAAGLKAFNTYCSDAGVSEANFTTIWKLKSGGGKKDEVVQAINQLDINKGQKDALYRCVGYSEKEIGKTPWHN